MKKHGHDGVELEPLTMWLQDKCTINWATPVSYMIAWFKFAFLDNLMFEMIIVTFKQVFTENCQVGLIFYAESAVMWLVSISSFFSSSTRKRTPYNGIKDMLVSLVEESVMTPFDQGSNSNISITIFYSYFYGVPFHLHSREEWNGTTAQFVSF